MRYHLNGKKTKILVIGVNVIKISIKGKEI